MPVRKTKITNDIRLAKLVREFSWFRQDMAKRYAASKRIFGRRVYLVDIHTHSTYSDGVDSVAENYRMGMLAGLDFMFATDHGSLMQKRVVKSLPRVGWGQEPGAGGHHIGLLQGRRLLRVRQKDKKTLASVYRAACEVAEFVWIPHPTGWYPQSGYKDECINQLDNMADEFAMEILNGANKGFRGYDEFARKSVVVWDRLLCAGRKITPLGGSDAHIATDVGVVWTGVYAARCTASSILSALKRGECFAGEAGLLHLSCNDIPMGGEVRCRTGGKLRLRFRAADAAGINAVHLFRDGRVVKRIAGGNQALVEGEFVLHHSGRRGYIRMELTASDDRRAFSAPIYLRS